MQEYEELSDVISLSDFDPMQWSIQEDSVLRPRLEAAGFYAVHFSGGEKDAFGWLSRTVSCIDNDGKLRHFIYG